ncbi:MAG TPA: universal stress protein [Xanthobacteraceae bacterium]|jgi:nucleotide-binding universal stress UspA family protein|nr:universal stress protein [Xanthobacteraceae bacterium]
MPKDIVVNLMVAGSRDAAATYAVSVAKTFDAHLAGIAFAYEPVLPAIVGGGIPESVIEEQREENEKAARSAVAQFEATAKDVKHETRMVPASLAGAADTFGEIARVFDLAIVGQSERDRVGPEELIVEGALFGSGRPILVVPADYQGGIRLDRVLVCWNGGRNAARATANALPFLRRANAVEIVTVGTEASAPAETSAADLSRHLARHGIKADVKRIEPGNLKVSAAILNYAAKSGAGMLVMGGYGHSRLREFILGGTTRGVLAAMTVPTLMSH